MALSPATGSARVLPSIALGSLGGALLFVARRRNPPPDPVPSSAPRLSGAGLAGLALGLGALAVFAPILFWLYGEYTESVWRNAHGLFLPLFMFLLARHSLRADPRGGAEASAWGFALLIPALALAALDAVLRSHHLSVFGLVLALPGLSLLLLGVRRSRMLALPLALGLFLIPIPMSFETPLGLPAATSITMEPVLELLGIPAVRHESNFLLPNGLLAISRNCAGLSTLYAAAALALVLAVVGRSPARRLLPLLLILPLTVLLNAVRGVVLVVLFERMGPQILETPLHGLGGVAVFWTVIGATWWVGDRRALRGALA